MMTPLSSAMTWIQCSGFPDLDFGKSKVSRYTPGLTRMRVPGTVRESLIASVMVLKMPRDASVAWAKSTVTVRVGENAASDSVVGCVVKVTLGLLAAKQSPQAPPATGTQATYVVAGARLNNDVM